MNTINHEQLVVGEWYSLANSSSFELVAIDESERCLEVQYYDGTIGEMGISASLLSGIERSASPIDMSGALDGVKDMEWVIPMPANGKWNDVLVDQLDQEAFCTEVLLPGIESIDQREFV